MEWVVVLFIGALVLLTVLFILSDSDLPKGIGRTIRSAIERRRVKQDRKHKLKLAQIEASKPPKATCECLHSLAFHRDGRCHHDVPRPTTWKTREIYPEAVSDFPGADVVGPSDDVEGNPMLLVRIPIKWEVGTCACIRYVGPEPMLTLTAPDLSHTAVEPLSPPVESPPDVARPYGLPSPAQGHRRADAPTYDRERT